MKWYIKVLNVRSHYRNSNTEGEVHFPEVLWSAMSLLFGINNKKLANNGLVKDRIKLTINNFPFLRQA